MPCDDQGLFITDLGHDLAWCSADKPGILRRRLQQTLIRDVRPKPLVKRLMATIGSKPDRRHQRVRLSQRVVRAQVSMPAAKRRGSNS